MPSLSVSSNAGGFAKRSKETFSLFTLALAFLQLPFQILVRLPKPGSVWFRYLRQDISQGLNGSACCVGEVSLEILGRKLRVLIAKVQIHHMEFSMLRWTHREMQHESHGMLPL